MAPILSKAVPPPPRSSAEKIGRWVQKNRGLFDSIFDVLKDVGMMTRMCKEDAESVFEKIRVKLDTACVYGARLLESLCCLDLNRFAKPEKPLTGSLPILFVLMLVVMLYNSFVFGYMPAAGIALNSRTSLIFHAWIFLLLASFVQAVRTDPGSTPMDAKWRDQGNPPPEARERKRCSDEARWCRKSGAYKPDRAHYCRVLNKGVLRMDHYCPWLANTVGFRNQKFFFLFLLYTNAACGQLGVSFIQLLVQYTLPALTTFCLVGAEGLTVLISSLLVPFFLFHFWLIARNTTTIEFCEKMRSRGERKGEETDEDDPTAPFRYDMGIFQNFCQVLGDNPLTWFLPVGGPSGDGINYPINPEYAKFFAHAQVATAPRASSTDIEQPEKASGQSEDPEATHPAASGTMETPVPVEGTKAASEGKQASEEDWEEYEGEEECSEVDSEAATSGIAQSEGVGDDGFLVWRNSAEFVEDLTIGCQFIGEKTEDCAKGSLLYFMSTCVPGALGRKAQRHLENAGHAPRKDRSSASKGYAASSKVPLRSSSPAVKVVSVQSGSGALSGNEAGGSCSSAGDFLSD